MTIWNGRTKTEDSDEMLSRVTRPPWWGISVAHLESERFLRSSHQFKFSNYCSSRSHSNAIDRYSGNGRMWVAYFRLTPILFLRSSLRFCAAFYLLSRFCPCPARIEDINRELPDVLPTRDILLHKFTTEYHLSTENICYSVDICAECKTKFF